VAKCDELRSKVRPAVIGKSFFLSFGGRKLTHTPEPIKVKFGKKELLPAKFHLDRCSVSPLWGEKTPNRPVSKTIPEELPAADPAFNKPDSNAQ